MENNTPTPEVVENNVVVDQNKNKNILIVVVVSILVILVILVVVLKDMNKKEVVQEQGIVSNTEMELDNAVRDDDTKSITDTLDSINLDDTSSTDLNDIDQELEKL